MPMADTNASQRPQVIKPGGTPCAGPSRRGCRSRDRTWRRACMHQCQLHRAHTARTQPRHSSRSFSFRLGIGIVQCMNCGVCVRVRVWVVGVGMCMCGYACGQGYASSSPPVSMCKRAHAAGDGGLRRNSPEKLHPPRTFACMHLARDLARTHRGRTCDARQGHHNPSKTSLCACT